MDQPAITSVSTQIPDITAAVERDIACSEMARPARPAEVSETSICLG